MNDSEQGHFGRVKVVRAKRGSCNHVKGVYNGKRIYCGNSARTHIKKEYGKDEKRCGLHDRDYRDMIGDDE